MHYYVIYADNPLHIAYRFRHFTARFQGVDINISLKPRSNKICHYCLIWVSQEESARLQEGVPCVKVHRYNQKHLYPKLNGYGDNGQRKVWSTGGSTHCTCQLTALSMSVLECGVILRPFSWFSSESFCAV
jgi:hypothetical protein